MTSDIATRMRSTTAATSTAAVDAAPRALTVVSAIRRFAPVLAGQRWKLALTVVLMFVEVATTVVTVAVFAHITDSVLVTGDLSALWVPLAVWVAVTVFGAVVGWLADVLGGVVTERILLRLRDSLYQHTQRLAPHTRRRFETGDLIARHSGDVDEIEYLVASGVVAAIVAVGSALVYSVAAFVTDWRLAVVAFLLAPLLAVVSRRFGRVVKDAARRERKANGRIMSRVQEGVTHAVAIQADNQSGRDRLRVLRESRLWRDARITELRANAAFGQTVAIIEMLCIMAVIVVGAWQISAGAATIGTLIALTGYLGYLYPQIQSLGSLAVSITSATASAERVAEIFDAPIGVADTHTLSPDRGDPLSASVVSALPADRVEAAALSADRVEAAALSADRVEARALPADRVEVSTLPADRVEVSTLPADRVVRGASRGRIEIPLGANRSRSDSAPRSVSPGSPAGASASIDSGTIATSAVSDAATIEFDDVRFGYPDETHDPDTGAGGRAILDGASVTIDSGDFVALLGESGAGKSTLMYLLLRFYDPWSGVIRLNGTDLRQMPVHDLREQVSVLPQRLALFHATVAENIAYACPDATDDRIREAAAAADALDFIDELPDGFGTMLRDDASNLSGGQRQRIGLARAFLRDAPLLILDEPTTGLDASTTERVMVPLVRLARSRTTVMITHDPVVAAVADYTLTIVDGRLTRRPR